MLQPPSCGLVRRNHFVPCVLPQRHGMTLVPLRPEIQCHSSPPFFFVFDHHFFFPAQLFGGFTLSDLLDKPWSQVPSLSPLGTCLHFLSRIGFSIPRCVLQVWRFSESGHHFHLPGSQIRLRDHMTTYRIYSGLRISTVYLRDLIVTCGIHSSWLAASNCRLSGSPIVFRDPQQCRLSYSCLLYTSPSPRDLSTSRMPSSA